MLATQVLKTHPDVDEAGLTLTVSKGLGPAAVFVADGRVHCACECVSLAQRLLGGIAERGEERGFLFAAAEAPVGEVAVWTEPPADSAADGAAAVDAARLCLLGAELRQGYSAVAACEGFLAYGDKVGNVWLAAAPSSPPAPPEHSPTAATAAGAAAAAAAGGWEAWLATTHWQGKRVTGVCLNGRAGWVLSGSLDGTLHDCRLRRPTPAPSPA